MFLKITTSLVASILFFATFTVPSLNSFPVEGNGNRLKNLEILTPKKSQAIIINDFNNEIETKITYNSNKKLETSATVIDDYKINLEKATDFFQTSIEIPGLNLKSDLQPATIANLKDLDKKMLDTPVFEKNYAQNICSETGNTYILGHSEPAKFSQRGYSGVYVFNKLHTLKPGDIINLTSFSGEKCSYKVFGWDKVETDDQDRVSQSEFDRALQPNYDFPSLTIQTCQLGSATVRLLLRAERIS
jgi:sortase (surface protein transpeptidase)